MTAKEYLLQYKRILVDLDAIERDIQDIGDELKNLDDVSIRSAWPDGQPHGTGTTDPVGNLASRNADRLNAERERLKERLTELKERRVSRRHELWDKRDEIQQTIDAVTDPTLSKLLRMRYIEGVKFEVIAVELCYTWRHTFRLHGEALQAVNKIINDK